MAELSIQSLFSCNMLLSTQVYQGPRQKAKIGRAGTSPPVYVSAQGGQPSVMGSLCHGDCAMVPCNCTDVSKGRTWDDQVSTRGISKSSAFWRRFTPGKVSDGVWAVVHL